jgi:hypothetical protein
MKILDKVITKKGYTYTQVYREGKLAIYKQQKHERCFYEAIRIKSHNGYTLGGAYIAPAETYPSSSVWGIDGFTYHTVEEAHKRLEKMKLEDLNVTPKQRGKRRIEVKISIPDGKFSVKEFAKNCNVNPALGYIRLKELEKVGQVKLVGEKRIGRGKPTKFYQKVK